LGGMQHAGLVVRSTQRLESFRYSSDWETIVAMWFLLSLPAINIAVRQLNIETKSIPLGYR
jgi:hypothetical protein